MAEKPDQRARVEIDWLLEAAGWAMQDCRQAQIRAARGVAIRQATYTLIPPRLKRVSPEVY